MQEMGRVFSVNVGTLREEESQGRTVVTGFFKEPVTAPLRLGPLGLEGDLQADLSVHGGIEKAVYVYPREHYPMWQRLLETEHLPPGSFGETLTTEGPSEDELCIGDVLRIGTALVQVRQPRSPCFKLQLRFKRSDMVAMFVRQSKPGWYGSVLREGLVSSNDPIERISRDPNGMSIADIWKYGFASRADRATQQHVLGLPLLPDFWKERICRP